MPLHMWPLLNLMLVHPILINRMEFSDEPSCLMQGNEVVASGARRIVKQHDHVCADIPSVRPIKRVCNKTRVSSLYEGTKILTAGAGLS